MTEQQDTQALKELNEANERLKEYARKKREGAEKLTKISGWFRGERWILYVKKKYVERTEFCTILRLDLMLQRNRMFERLNLTESEYRGFKGRIPFAMSEQESKQLYATNVK